MSRRALTSLALITACSLAACSDDGQGDRQDDGQDAAREGGAATANLDVECPQAPTHVVDPGLSDTFRIGQDVYGVSGAGVVKVTGDAQEVVHELGDDVRLEILAGVEGDLVVFANHGAASAPQRLFRLDPSGETVWETEVEEGSPSVRDPDAVAVVQSADRAIDLDTGEDIDWTEPVPDDEMFLDHDGRDHVLADRSTTARVYNDFDGNVVVTDPHRDVLLTLTGAAAVCGDRLYTLDDDGALLTTYRVDGGELAAVAKLELPRPATQNSVTVTGSAVQVDGLLLTD